MSPFISCPHSSCLILTIKVLRRRFGGNNQPCNTDWRQDDNHIRLEIIKKVGCVPPHWRLQMSRPSLGVSSIRDCLSQDEMHRCQIPQPSFVHSKFLENYTPPCDAIFSMSLKKETNGNNDLSKFM